MHGRFILVVLVFLLGLYVFAYYGQKEAFTATVDAPRCHDVLLQDNGKFYLFNSKLAKVPGVNPITFDNLEEYVEFTEWQRSQGIICPVLFLQQASDTQGNTVYKVRNCVTNFSAGTPDFIIGQGVDVASRTTKLLDANRDVNPPYNKNSYPGFDPQDQDIGLDTPLDRMFHETNSMGISPNPMDTNWAGHAYTQGLIDQGFYKDREVTGYGGHG